MPITPATQETEFRRITVQGQHSKKVIEPPLPQLIKRKKSWAWDIVPVVEHLPGKSEVLRPQVPIHIYIKLEKHTTTTKSFYHYYSS
jgi:hypothetical protein